MKRPVPVHYLRANESVWTPPAVCCLDTETRATSEGDDEVHSLRLWVARFTDRRPPSGVMRRDEYAHGDTGEDLACQLHEWCKYRKTVWCYAHNLHFDLCTSSLVQELCTLGWEVTDFAVDGAVPFVRLERGGKRLALCDSWSWLPVPLADVGAAVGITKPPLPADDDGRSIWLSRCAYDTEILSAAMLTLMQWWDDNQLGRWSITGGAAGWNVMRHLPSHRKILIDPDPDKVAADRLAIYGGRRGQWRTGRLPAGRYSELDLHRAYTVACRDFGLPYERIATFDSLSIDHPWVIPRRYGIIARVLIETDIPRWPVRIDRRVWYPVGRFWTVLAGPDIAEAARLGALKAIGRGEVHKLGYALRPWALWCLDRQADTSGATPEVAKITLRHWGHAVVGKWAQRGFTRLQLGAAPTLDWGFMPGWHHDKDVRASIVDFGGTRWQVTAAGDADNAYPAILAFVESYVRVALGRAAEAIGPVRMISCDTDGMLVDCRDTGRIEAAVAAVRPFTLREKAFYRQVEAIGPQHAILDGRRRFAGVPASAAQLPDGRLEARLWPKLAWQIQHGRAGAYVRPSQAYRIGGTYAPGWVLASGAVVPVQTVAFDDGHTSILPWPLTRYAMSGARLGAHQNPYLGRFHAFETAIGSAADPPGRDLRRTSRGERCAQSAPASVLGVPAGRC